MATDWESFLDDLKRDEGLRSKPYTDAAGKLTIGVGRNLTDVGLSAQEIEYLLENDAHVALEAAQNFLDDDESFARLSLRRQYVLANMAFNMGLPRLRTFRRFRAALLDGLFSIAADEMLDSKWALQVGERAQRLAREMREG